MKTTQITTPHTQGEDSCQLEVTPNNILMALSEQDLMKLTWSKTLLIPLKTTPNKEDSPSLSHQESIKEIYLLLMLEDW